METGMQFFRFWTRADSSATGRDGEFSVTCFGYSNTSLEDALRVAERRAKAAATAMADGQLHKGGYYEGERPFREEIVDEFTDDGQQIGIISRNNYGVLVLNTPNVFIADVDKPKASQAKSLFGLFKKKQQEPSFEQQLIEKIDNLCLQDSSLGLRLYRTMNGYRIIITTKLIPASEANSVRLLDELGSDRLYVSLCKTQDCYRARLTPKPWRCGFKSPSTKFPFRSNTEEQEFRRWEKEYESAVRGYASCALIGDFGSSHRDPIVDKIVQLHDHFSLDGEKPLA